MTLLINLSHWGERFPISHYVHAKTVILIPKMAQVKEPRDKYINKINKLIIITKTNMTESIKFIPIYIYTS